MTIPVHDAFRGLPLMVERSMFKESDGRPIWEIRHDPVTATMVVQYTAGVFCDHREIDHMTSVVQQQLHDLMRKVKGKV